MSLALERDIFDEIRDLQASGYWFVATQRHAHVMEFTPTVEYVRVECHGIPYPRLLRRYARGVMPTSRWNVRVKCALSEKPTVCAT